DPGHRVSRARIAALGTREGLMAMRAVIFDFDGVLVNSEPLHFRAMREALLPEAIDITSEEYDRHYLAYDDREAMRVALEVHGRGADPAAVDRAAFRK